MTDAGFSAGIKTVQSSVRSTYEAKCKRKGRTVTCTKHRTIKPSVAALTSTRFKVVASKLPYGTQRFTLVAIDKAGHRQALPTTKTVKTKKPTNASLSTTRAPRPGCSVMPRRRMRSPRASRGGEVEPLRDDAQDLGHLHRREGRAQAAAHAAAERDPREGLRRARAPSQRSGRHVRASG